MTHCVHTPRSGYKTFIHTVYEQRLTYAGGITHPSLHLVQQSTSGSSAGNISLTIDSYSSNCAHLPPTQQNRQQEDDQSKSSESCCSVGINVTIE